MQAMVRLGPLTDNQRTALVTLAFKQGKPSGIVKHEGQDYLPIRLEDFHRLVSVQRKGEALADVLIEAIKNDMARF